MAIDDATCICSKQRGARSCKRQDLNDEAKLWFYFIRHTIMQTGHVFSLNQERKFLIDVILDGSPINIGQIIEKQIKQCASRIASELLFPSLLTTMCRKAGVATSNQGRISYAVGTITLHDIRRFMPMQKLSASQPLVVPDHPPPEEGAMDINVAPPPFDASPDNKTVSMLSDLSNSSFQPSDHDESIYVSDLLIICDHYPPADSDDDVTREDPYTDQDMPDAVPKVLAPTPASSVPTATLVDHATPSQ